MAKLTKNFAEEEFFCSCCKKQEMDDEFMRQLQDVRSSCGFGFKINSGWRCDEHNAKVSKNSMGDHTRGLACDVHVNDRYKRASLLRFALNSDYFKDVAISKTFIHLGRGRNKQGIGIYG